MKQTNIMGSSKVKILTLEEALLSPEQIEEEIRKFEEKRKAEEINKEAQIEEQKQAPILTPSSDFQLFGPGKYQDVMSQISQKGLLRPTTAQTLALVHQALQTQDEENFKILLEKFRKDYLWTSTENLYGKDDVIVYDNIDGNMPRDRKILIKRMKDGDSSIRVVPYGFKTGIQSISDFIKNPYVIAQVRDLPLDIVANITEKISENQHYVYALDSKTKDLVRYSAVDSGWDVDWLCLDGDCDGSNESGYVFGVRSQKNSRGKK